MDFSLLTLRERSILNEAGEVFERRRANPIPVDSRARFLARLKKYGFKLGIVGQDKHALFRVLSQFIFGSEDDYKMMRVCVATKIRANSERYKSLLKGENLNSYCTHVKNDFRGDKLCVLAACELFQVTFRALHDNPYVVFTEVAPSKKHPNQLRPLSRKVIWCSISDAFGVCPILKTTEDEDFVDDIQDDVDLLRQSLSDPAQVIEICERLLAHLPAKHVLKCQYARLNQRISEWGFGKVNVIGDGNCILRTLSYIVFKTEEKHILVREMVVAKLKTNQGRYDSLRHIEKHPTEGRHETYQEFVSRMAQPREWGDGACMQAAADMFHIMITVVDSDKEIIIREFVPLGRYYFTEVYSCENSHHADAMFPVQEFLDWREYLREGARLGAIRKADMDASRDFSSSLIRLFGPEE